MTSTRTSSAIRAAAAGHCSSMFAIAALSWSPVVASVTADSHDSASCASSVPMCTDECSITALTLATICGFTRASCASRKLALSSGSASL